MTEINSIRSLTTIVIRVRDCCRTNFKQLIDNLFYFPMCLQLAKHLY